MGQALDALNVRTDKMIDSSPFLDSVEKKHGMAGEIIALDIMKAMKQHLHISPYALIRNVEWSDITELEGLFKSQSLETQYGTFFDQRFIDFLGQNFERIDDIHWRKFEALTCEFFERHGYYVEIGPGTNDDGVDARAWQTDPANGGPPTILIQCKRRRDKVEKTIVKALYADILHENANKGLIVTSQTLAPVAEHVRVARSYPIEQVDRHTLKKWVEVMRSPGTGIFMM